MKGRDVAIAGAIAIVAIVAAVDAVRGGGGEGAENGPDTRGALTGDGPVEESPSPAPTRPEVLVPVAAPGTLVLTDGDDCHVRAIRVTSGVEVPLPRLAGDCALWAAPSGSRIAYGLDSQGSDSLATASFRIVDLRRPRENLGGFRALFGFLVFSADGSRAAWCGESRTGYDLELGGPARRLDDCPSAFDPAGRIAYATGNRVVVEGRTVLQAEGGVTFVRWGTDGSLAVVIDGKRVERWVDGRPAGALDLPRWLEGRLPKLSPDNCAALFTRPTRVDL